MTLSRIVRWPLIFALGALGILILLSGCGRSDDSWERIQESGILRIGVDPTFPPFAVTTGDTIEGIDIDLARALAAELGLETQFSHFGYDGLYDALTTGQVDVLISALVIAPERTKEISYTTPYFDAGLYLFFPDSGRFAKGIGDMNGSTLAVELGSLGHVEALNRQKQDNNLTVLPYESVDAAMAAAAEGEADAALVDYVSGRLFLRDNPAAAHLTFAPISGASEPYAMAVRIGDESLLNELNAALTRLSTSGRLEAIIMKHLGQ